MFTTDPCCLFPAYITTISPFQVGLASMCWQIGIDGSCRRHKIHVPYGLHRLSSCSHECRAAFIGQQTTLPPVETDECHYHMFVWRQLLGDHILQSTNNHEFSGNCPVVHHLKNNEM
jgi:hypothetical protein